MLNLNLNILGALQPRIDRPGVFYFVRNDEFKDSIVLAMPGTLFINDQNGQPSFEMSSSFDDISAYVRGGANNPPSGSNIPMLYVTGPFYSASIATTPLSPFTYDLQTSDPYSGSTRLDGSNGFIANRLYDEGQGLNIGFGSSWVIESYVAFEETGSYPPGIFFTPARVLAWHYNPDGWFWDSNFGAPSPPFVATPLTGSNRFIYDSVAGPTPAEFTITGSSGAAVVPFEWRHYAISYTASSRDVRLYVNGILLNTTNIPEGRIIAGNSNNPINIFGTVDTGSFPESYDFSAASFQDFRFYNGTNKNYTGSVIPLPESIVSNYYPFSA
jgi:hypothetical protein